MRKKKEKNLEISNVIKLAIICSLVIIAVLLLRNWYLKNQKFEKGIPVLTNVLTHQIKPNELHNFINDNNTAIIYLCVSNDETCRTLEKDMKPFIEKNSLEDIIIYLDLTSKTEASSFFKELNSAYNSPTTIEEYPCIIYFENAMIEKVLSGKDVSISNIEKFLKGAQLIS